MEWDESSQKYLYSVKKNAYAYCVSVICITLTLLYIIYDAKSFVEYTEALFACSTAFMCIIITTFIYLKLDDLSEMTKLIRTTLNEGMCTSSINVCYINTIYQKLNFS